METTLREQIAEYLRRAAKGTITEEDFYIQFRRWHQDNKDDLLEVIFREAEHFWANFHERNIFLIPVKPDKHALEFGRQRLLILAQALEEEWNVQKAEEAIADY